MVQNLATRKIEKKIHMLQECLERSKLKDTATTATAWMTVGKMIERTVNSIPMGYLFHGSGGNNPLLRILTPNSLRLISASDRAPAGLFNIPNNRMIHAKSIHMAKGPCQQIGS